MENKLEERIKELGDILNSTKKEKYQDTYDTMSGQYAPRRCNTWVTETLTRVVPKYSKKERFQAYKELTKMKKNENENYFAKIIDSQTRDYEKQRSKDIGEGIKSIITIGALTGVLVGVVFGIYSCNKKEPVGKQVPSVQEFLKEIRQK